MNIIQPHPDTFCAVPFTNIRNSNNGEWGTFCDGIIGGSGQATSDKLSLVWNNEFYKQLRLDSINGVKNSNCTQCWRNESTGNFSMRKSETACYSTTDILSRMNQDGTMRTSPEVLDIKLGNLCNAKCIMCCQLYSSQHEAEIAQWKKSGITLPSALNYIENTFAQGRDYRATGVDVDNFDILDSVKLIRIAGGEPMINPKVRTLLNRIQNINVKIEIITNLSEIDFELLSRFPNLHITGSIDHVDSDKFKFIRFPLDYHQCINNFIKVNHSKEISFTASIFNILDLDLIFDTFATLDVPVSFNYALEPNYWSVRYLEPDQKEQVIAMVQRMMHNQHKVFVENHGVNKYFKSIHQLLRSIPDDFSSVVKERTKWLQLYDNTRKTNSKKLFPFIKDYE